MEIHYKTNKLKQLCEDPNCNVDLAKKYGKEVADKLPRRIKELHSFNNLQDVPIVPPYRRHKLTGNRNGQFAIMITSQYRLIFRQYDKGIIIDDLSEIKEIEVLEVSKHYE